MATGNKARAKARGRQGSADDAEIAKHLASERTKIAVAAIKWGAILACVYFLAKAFVAAVASLAGLETRVFVSAFVTAIIEKPGPTWKDWLLGGLGVLALVCVGWAVGERYFRRQKTAQLTARIAQLELIIDPERSSSELLQDGRTRPDDH